MSWHRSVWRIARPATRLKPTGHTTKRVHLAAPSDQLGTLRALCGGASGYELTLVSGESDCKKCAVVVSVERRMAIARGEEVP